MPSETEYATVNTLFTQGMAHATIASPWFVPTVRKAGIDVSVAPMTVVDINMYEMGQEAGRLVLQKLKHPATQVQTYITAPTLVLRGTTCPRKTE